MQPATAAFTLLDQNNVAVPGVTSYNASTHTFTLRPSSLLRPDANYHVTVSGARDATGNLMSAPATWSFMTGFLQPTDRSPPTTVARALAVSPSHVWMDDLFDNSENETTVLDSL
jgi:hypothetical protein